jgi:N-acetylglucosamine-6-phosphate deacetylase
VNFLARRFDTGQTVKVDIAGDRIVSVSAIDGSTASTPAAPSSRGAGAPVAAPADDLPWVAPGFVDIQVNGYGGQEFSSPELTPEKVAAIVRQHYAFGVTGICPTLTTQSLATLEHGLRAIAAACEQFPEIGRRIVGAHVEGPFITPEDGPRGAHPAKHCRRPDWDAFCRLQEAAGGRIKILTMSVEFDESPDFIARATASGVVIAIGHTAANSAHIRAAVDAGARLSTHLGNGAHRQLRRHPNYLWDQLAEDRLMASLIVDGHHLPGEVVKCFVRGKTPERCILVSDLSGLAGLPVGRYQTSGCELEILADGRLVIAGQDQLLAGASLPIGVGIVNVMRFAGVHLRTAVEMATKHPAELIGLPVATLRPGDRADLVLFDLRPAAGNEEHAHLQVCATLADGQLVHGSLPAARNRSE